MLHKSTWTDGKHAHIIKSSEPDHRSGPLGFTGFEFRFSVSALLSSVMLKDEIHIFISYHIFYRRFSCFWLWDAKTASSDWALSTKKLAAKRHCWLLLALLKGYCVIFEAGLYEVLVSCMYISHRRVCSGLIFLLFYLYLTDNLPRDLDLFYKGDLDREAAAHDMIKNRWLENKRQKKSVQIDSQVQMVVENVN